MAKAKCDIADGSIAEDCCVDGCGRRFLVLLCKMLTVQDKLHNGMYAATCFVPG